LKPLYISDPPNQDILSHGNKIDFVKLKENYPDNRYYARGPSREQLNQRDDLSNSSLSSYKYQTEMRESLEAY